ncbi:variable large family protein [Borrelia hermsii]|uniref:variable large family protein n=1 Tax=Borrelia hermsii TaxID=140 RepID=UPI0023EA650D|nr:variable large family protein [Borrelia hermsii]
MERENLQHTALFKSDDGYRYNSFATGVKEIATLVKSIDALAKAIGKKTQQESDQLSTDNAKNHNGLLITGVFQVILTVSTKLEALEREVAKISGDLKAKVTATKTESKTFLEKPKSKSDTLGKEGATDGNCAKVKTVVDKFITGTLDKIAAGAKEAAKGATGAIAIGGATAGQDAAPAEAASVNALVKGIKIIVGIVLKENEGNAEATGKLLGTNAADGTEAQAAATSASIRAVSGADILQAIAESVEAANNEIGIDQAENAARIAAAKKEAKEFKADQKDAVIAAGIALRAMAKDGKFTAKQNEEKSANAVNGAAASAVGKTLSTLIIAIRNTVDSGLRTINEALATVKQADKSAEATNPAEATTSGQQAKN